MPLLSGVETIEIRLYRLFINCNRLSLASPYLARVLYAMAQDRRALTVHRFTHCTVLYWTNMTYFKTPTCEHSHKSS